jgi:hypothetical protein
MTLISAGLLIDLSRSTRVAALWIGRPFCPASTVATSSKSPCPATVGTRWSNIDSTLETRVLTRDDAGTPGRSTYIGKEAGEFVGTERMDLSRPERSEISVACNPIVSYLPLLSSVLERTSSAPNIATAPSRPVRGPCHSSSVASLLGQKMVILNPLAELVFSAPTPSPSVPITSHGQTDEPRTRTESGSSHPVRYQKLDDCRNL